jgi:hypothetical protein
VRWPHPSLCSAIIPFAKKGMQMFVEGTVLIVLCICLTVVAALYFRGYLEVSNRQGSDGSSEFGLKVNKREPSDGSVAKRESALHADRSIDGSDDNQVST